MRDLIEFLLGTEAMLPHGYCFLWRPSLVWLSVIANLSIAVAYFSIPIALLYFSHRRKDFYFGSLALIFSSFICACGLTHLISVFTIWTPIYGLQASVEALTGVISSVVAIKLWFMMPSALKLPSTQSLQLANQELSDEIKHHEATKAELLRVNATLDELVALKTKELIVSEQRFHSIFEKAPLGIAVINSLTGNFMDVNPTCEQIIGRQKEDILGLNWMDITHPDDVHEIRKAIALSMLNVGTRAAVKITKRYIRPDNTQVWVKMTSVPIFPDKDSPYFLQLIEDVTEAYLAEQQVKKQANILEQSLNEVYVLDVDSLRIKHVNQSAIQNLGFNYNDLCNLTLWDITIGIDASTVNANLELLKNDQQNQIRFEGRHRRQDGSQYSVEVCVQIYRNSPDYLVAICLDITQRQTAEQALINERNLLLNLINNNPDFISYKNLAGEYVYCNERFAQSLNRSVSQIIGQTSKSLLDFSRLQGVIKRDHTVLEQNQPLVFEDQLSLPNHQTIDVEIFKTPFKNAEGKTLGLLSVVRDITERKAQEAKITRLSHLYSCLSKASHAYMQVNNIIDLFSIVCNATANLPTVELVWIAHPDKTMCMKPIVSAGHLLAVLQHQHIPIDAPTLENQNPLARCYHHNRMIIDNSTYVSEFGMDKGAFCSVPIWENGKKYAVLTVLSSDSNYFDDAAMILMAELGLDLSFALDSYQDIAAKKIADEKLRLSAQVFNQTQEGIIITNAKNLIVSVNPAFTVLTGYEEQEVVGKNPRLLSSGQHSSSFYQQLWDELLENDFWQGEIWNRHKNGSSFAEWMSISLIRDVEGKISHHIAMFSDITAHVNALKHIEFLAHYDALTKLPNRALLQSRLEYELLTSARNKQIFALLFIDLDRFKHINDSLGHAMGDLVLIEVARRLLNTVREEDTVARLGGDEFNILLPGCNATGAAIVANKIVLALAEPLLLESYKLHVSPSIGISLYPDNGQSYDVLARSADTAMYQAKHNGRNQFQFYTQLMQEQTQKRLIMESDLRTALENQELLIHFQPQVDTQSGEIIGAEALLRWNHPSLGNIPPSEFVSIAEDCGLMAKISDWVLEQSIAQNHAWHESGYPLTISVILSHVQICDAHLIEKVRDLLDKYQLSAEYLELEITESTAMKDIYKTIEVTRQLAALGLKLSIIDFGMGYSTFNYLQDLSLYKLKIDRFFIKGVVENIDKENLVDVIIHMAKSLNLKIIARGIETEQQLEIFKDKNCDEFQGFYFSKPIPADEFLTLIQQQPNEAAE